MQARRGLFTNGSLFKNVCMVLNILPDIYHLDYNHLTRLYQKLMGFLIFFFFFLRQCGCLRSSLSRYDQKVSLRDTSATDAHRREPDVRLGVEA